jgi:hypothetical protein
MTSPGHQGTLPGAGHWHGAFTTYAASGALASIVADGPFGTEAAAREALAGQVATEQGDLMVLAESGHVITLAEAWLQILAAPVVFTLPGEGSRTFSTYPCAGDCDAAREAHVLGLPERVARERRPLREQPPARDGLALPPIFNELPPERA